MQIITVGGFKGGTGKTTVAALLGVAAVHQGLRVAALDLDRNTRNMSSFVTRRRAGGLASPDHVMLMDLQQPIRAGGSIPLTLTFEDAKGVKSTLALQVPVQAGAPGMVGHKH